MRNIMVDLRTYPPNEPQLVARGPLPPPLREALNDPDPRLRRVVVEAVQLAGNPLAGSALQPLAADPDPAVRRAVGAALAALGPGV